MHFRLPLRLLALVLVVLTGVVGAARAAHPTEAQSVKVLRAAVDTNRALAWTYQRAARQHRTPTSFSYRRSPDAHYLHWTLVRWQVRADHARRTALARLHKRLGVALPPPPGLHAAVTRRVAYDKKLTLRLHRIYPGRSNGRSLASAHAANLRRALVVWERRAAAATLAVSLHARRTLLDASPALISDFLCIHRFEGGWGSNTGNGYYGGLQMDWTFMRRYGADFVGRWGTADRWPPWAQLQTAVRAYDSGRGFYPWPNTARACGLL